MWIFSNCLGMTLIQKHTPTTTYSVYRMFPTDNVNTTTKIHIVLKKKKDFGLKAKAHTTIIQNSYIHTNSHIQLGLYIQLTKVELKEEIIRSFARASVFIRTHSHSFSGQRYEANTFHWVDFSFQSGFCFCTDADTVACQKS